jgi:hypothetical protein
VPVTPAAARRSELTPAQDAPIRRHIALIPVRGNIDERAIDQRGEPRRATARSSASSIRCHDCGLRRGRRPD